MLNTKFDSSSTKNIEQANLLPVNITNQINKLRLLELVDIHGIIRLYLLAKPLGKISDFFYYMISDEFIGKEFADFIDLIQDFDTKKLRVLLKVIERKTVLI